jgi:hypothetical protein
MFALGAPPFLLGLLGLGLDLNGFDRLVIRRRKVDRPGWSSKAVSSISSDGADNRKRLPY